MLLCPATDGRHAGHTRTANAYDSPDGRRSAWCVQAFTGTEDTDRFGWNTVFRRLNEDTQGIEVNTCQQRGSITLCWSYSKGVLNYPRVLCLTWGGSITQHHFTWAICQHEQPSCVPSVTQQRCCSLAEAGGGCSQSKPLATLGEAASLKWLVTLNSLNSLLEPYIYLIFHSQSRIWGIQFKDSLQQKWYAVLNVTHLDDAEQKCNAIYRKHRCKEEPFYVLLWHSTLAAALLLNKYAWTIGGCTPSPGCELISRS